jgi:hypothetical protein
MKGRKFLRLFYFGYQHYTSFEQLLRRTLQLLIYGRQVYRVEF